MTGDSWLVVDNVSRHYRRGPHVIRAVDNVSCTVDKGELVALVGSSGSGKSTLLNLLAGLDRATSGSISVAGTALSAMPRRELAAYRARRVGMVFQSFNLLAHKTALGNVELALYFTDTPRHQRRLKAAEMLDRLGLGDRQDHHPADLSGGEQQRVAIARALVKRPEVIFADEPTGNLDRDNSRQIADLLRELNSDGQTIVMVTHDLPLAESLARRTLHMDYGRLIDSDTAGGAS